MCSQRVAQRRRNTLVEQDFQTLWLACLSTTSTCALVTPGNHSMKSPIDAPLSRFSKRADTGILVPRKTHAPFIISGERSTAGHDDQSSIVAGYPRAAKYQVRATSSMVPFGSLRDPFSKAHPSIWKAAVSQVPDLRYPNFDGFSCTPQEFGHISRPSMKKRWTRWTRGKLGLKIRKSLTFSSSGS